jgi:hypothetical protein
MAAEERGELSLEYVRVADLPPDPDNPKRHEIEGIRRSIAELGYIEPAILDGRTGTLIAGHGRKEALTLMEAEGDDVPRGIVKRKDGWYSPVIHGWASDDDDMAKAALVGLNEWVIQGGYEPHALVAVLQRLDASPRPHLLALAGSSKQRLDDLMLRLGAPPSLDHLRDQHGAHNASDFWPALRFVVPPELKSRYEAVMAACALPQDATDADRFTALIEKAEQAVKA